MLEYVLEFLPGEVGSAAKADLVNKGRSRTFSHALDAARENLNGKNEFSVQLNFFAFSRLVQKLTC